jgi:hypothetical protein
VLQYAALRVILRKFTDPKLQTGYYFQAKPPGKPPFKKKKKTIGLGAWIARIPAAIRIAIQLA